MIYKTDNSCRGIQVLSPTTRRSIRSLRFGLLVLLVAFTATGIVGAQQLNGQRITPNFRDVEIGQVIDAVAQVTGKTIIPDPRVRAQVTMLSQTPMTPGAFYEAFLALLQVHQFVAVESGNVIRIVPDANARQLVNQDLPDRVRGGSEELVTQVVAGQERQCRADRAGVAPAAAAVRAPRRLSGQQHPHHLGSRQQREPHHAHHPAHRPGGRQRCRHHQSAARLRSRGRARRQHLLRAAGRRGRRRRLCGARDRRRSLEQRPRRR